MTDQQKKKVRQALPQEYEAVSQQNNMNVPILAFSENVANMGGQNNQGIIQVSEAYNIQFQQQDQQQQSSSLVPTSSSKLSSQNNLSNVPGGRKVNQDSNFQDAHVLRNQQQQSISTPKGNRKGSGEPDKIFDPKPPSNLPVALPGTGHNSNGTNQQQQPIQNVYQFNVRVNNNNMHGGGILVGGDSNAQVQAQNSHGQVSQNNKNGTSTNGVYTAAGTKSKSRERRPASSKAQNQPKGWQANSTTSSTNAYFGQQVQNPNNNVRRVIRKRPQSANRKIVAVSNGPLRAHHPHAVQAASFKSPGMIGTTKKHSFMFSGPQQNSQPTKQQHRHLQTQMAQNATHTMSNELAMSDQSHGALSMPPGSYHPYTKSLKLPNQFNSTAITFSGNKMNNSQGMFGSPEKGARQIKNKIPSMTLQSREDLYEQNMQTKMQINTLRNENRKINTKLIVLENQLVQKDKLFEDMYRAAFTQVRQSAGIGNHNQGVQSHQQVVYSANFHPQNQHNSGGTFSPQKSAYAPNPQQSHNNQQQHAQAQQLISSYKRTIREQSKELDKRDGEIDKIKRSVKMTQINQVLIENEAYRTECIRLREELENAIIQQQLQQQAIITNQTATNNTLEVVQQTISATETFKRDTHNPIVSSQSPIHRSQERQERHQEQLDQAQHQNESLNQQNAQLHSLVNELGQVRSKLQNEAQELKQELHDTQQSLHQAQQAAEQSQQKMAQVDEQQKTLSSQMTQEVVVPSSQQPESEVNEVQTSRKASIDQLHQDHKAQIGDLQLQISGLQAQKFELAQKLEERQSLMVNPDLQEENASEMNKVKEMLEAEKEKFTTLEKQMNDLVSKNANGADQIQKLSKENELVMKKAKSTADAAMKSQKVNMERGQMLNQQEGEISDLREMLRELELRLKDSQALNNDVDSLRQKLEYKTNAQDAQKYEYETKLEERDAQIMELKQQLMAAESKRHQSLPVAPGSDKSPPRGGRRSTKKSNNFAKAGSASAFGESDFDRADSEAPSRTNNKSQNQMAVEPAAYDAEDRSDLGFSSADGESDDPAPIQATANESKKPDKIQVNDKTIFGPNGLPLSPKEINKDSPNVKEGLLRLRYACQVKMIRHDSIENFLFGNNYKPEMKLSISMIKESAMTQLKMDEVAALDFGRYLVQQGGTLTYDESEAGNSHVFIDQTKSLLAIRIIMFLTSQIQPELIYYRPEKEEKMKLIIGEKLQDMQSKTRVLSTVQRHKSDSLLEGEFRSIFDQANLVYNKETLQCCFIFLLKKTDNLMQIRKADLVSFIHTVGKQAYDFTMTGSKFPMETELVYSSDSDEDGGQIADEVNRNKDNIDKSSEGPAKEATFKSAGQVNHQAPMHQQHPIDVQPMRQHSSDAVKPDAKNFNSAPQPATTQSQGNNQEDNYSDDDDDDDFGANESRSEYSAQIPEEIKSEIHPEELKQQQAQYLSLQSQGVSNTIEDSINDRDLDCSVAKIGNLSVPLNKVVEAQEHQECTIEKDQGASNKENDVNGGVSDLAIIKMESIEKKNTMPINESKINETNNTVMSQSQNSANSENNNKTGSKGRRPKLNLNIDVNAVKNTPVIKQPAPVLATQGTIGNAKPIIQMQNVDNLSSGSQHSGTGLQVLKPDIPVPIGITVTHQQHSEYGHDSRRSKSLQEEKEEEDFSKFVALKNLGVPGGITVTHQEHSEYGGRLSVISNGVTETRAADLHMINQDSQQDLQEEERDKFETDNEKHELELEAAKIKDPVRQTSNIVAESLKTDSASTNYQMPEPEYEDVKEQPSTAGLKDASKFQIGVTSVDKEDASLSYANKIDIYQNISLPSASRLVDDSFGQQSYQFSAEKPKNNLPPFELMQLKVEAIKPQGIMVNELLTDRSSRQTNTINKSSAQINDFDAGKDSDDYSQDPDEDEYIKTQSGQSQSLSRAGEIAESPTALKDQIQKNDSQQALSAIKPVAQASAEGANQSEIEEDYEF